MSNTNINLNLLDNVLSRVISWLQCFFTVMVSLSAPCLFWRSSPLTSCLILHFSSSVLSFAWLFTLICFTCVLLTCLSSVRKPVFSFIFASSLLFLTCLHTTFFQCIFQWIFNVSQCFQSFALLVPAFLGFLPMTNGLTIGLTFPVKLLLFTCAIRSFELHQCWLHCLYLWPPLSTYLLECDKLN